MAARKSRSTHGIDGGCDGPVVDAFAAVHGASAAAIYDGRDADLDVLATLEAHFRRLAKLHASRRVVLETEEETGRMDIADAEAAHRELFLEPEFASRAAEVRSRDAEAAAWSDTADRKRLDATDPLRRW